MKKLFPIFTCILLLASCNNGAATTSSADTSSISTTSETSLSTSASTSSETSSLEPESKMVEKDIKAFRLFNRDNEYLDPDLNDDKYKLGTVPLSFVKGDDFIPYITLEDLADLYAKFYLDKDNTRNIITEDDVEHTWEVMKDDNVVFSSTINTEEKDFTCSGNLEKYIEPKKDYSKHSLVIRYKSEATSIDLGDQREYVTSYEDTEFEIIQDKGVTYFPFSMMHTLFHELTGHDFFFNYVYLYEYNNVDDISKATITDGDNIYTLVEQMTGFIDEKVKEKDANNKPLMPLYLRKYHRSNFTLIMDNYYGLRNAWGVNKMSDLYKAYGLYDNFIDENSAVRGAAYYEAFFMLSDNHTGQTILNADPWGETNGNTEVDGAERSPFTVERTLLDNALAEQRDKFLKDNGFEDGIKNALIYSADGKTAYFGFDSFEGTMNGFKPDGTPKSDEKLAEVDSYFYFLKMLRAIVAHNQENATKVTNVIIDDSLNGGGIIGIMGKLLALLSKDNNATITSMSDITYQVTKTVYHVDSNADGKYDAEDVYGNMFNFFILTSPLSFSCGNAFPLFAQQQFSHVKIIGVKSGGGECVVGDNYIPNGIGFAHSSSEHIILLNEQAKTYVGVESGVNVDATIKYNNFYNMTEMLKAIEKLQNN